MSNEPPPPGDKPPSRPGSRGVLAHLADQLGDWDIATVRRDLTAQADRSLDEQNRPIPPGPWTWRRVIPEAPTEFGWPEETEEHGLALVAADGSWLVSSESGWGVPEIHSPEVKAALARAWLLVPAPGVDLADDRVEATVAVGLLAEVKKLEEQLRAARSWAWFLRHGTAPAEVLGDDPDWLDADTPPWAEEP